MPDEHSPESRHHGGGLAYGIGDRHAGKASGDQVKHSSDAPNESSQEAEKVAGSGRLEEATETDRFTHQRVFHEVDIPNEAGEQGTQRKKNCRAVGSQRVAGGHGMRHEWRPKSHQNTGYDANDDAFLR